MTTKTIETIQRVLTHTPDQEHRIALDLPIGKAVQQGDIYLFRVADNHPRGKPWGSRQVAVGTTIGQRHVATGDLEVFAGVAGATDHLQPLFDEQQRRECLGPVVVAKARWDLEHPEHPWHGVPAGTYQVCYQWSEAMQRRVED